MTKIETKGEVKKPGRGVAGFVYTCGIHIYQAALRAASLRNRKARLMLEGRSHSTARLREALQPKDRPVWLHAASLGEFEQGRPLLEQLRREQPGRKIVLSFYSPSGYEIRKDWGGADAVVYLPADTPRAMRRFIDMVNPAAAIFVKYEFWGNCLAELSRRGVPTYLISAVFRPEQVFFKSYGGHFRRMLHVYRHIYVQNEDARKLLASVGVKSVTVAGDTRFDRVTDIMRSTHRISELERLTRGGTRFTFMAGSSWPADEAVYFPWLKSRGETVVSVIAPHEFDNARLQRMKDGLLPEVKSVLLSEIRDKGADLSNVNCLIIDCYGLLSSAYRYANLAYVGGGFGTGIHNINEAAVYGVPVVFGPRHGKFIEAGELKECGGGYSVDSEEDCGKLLDRLMDDSDYRDKSGRAAGAYIQSKIGATPRIYNDISARLGVDV